MMNKYNTLNEGYKSEDNVLKKKDNNESNIMYPKYKDFFKKPDGKEPTQMIIDEYITKPKEEKNKLDWTDIADNKLPIEEKQSICDMIIQNTVPAKFGPMDPPVININYGENTLSFKDNGEIRLNDRLLETDKEIVDALRKLLKIDYDM